MSAEKIRGKRWWRKEKRWHCVDLVATLTELPHPYRHHPPSPFLVLPTSSPGNKDFHSCARGDAQRERKEGGVGRRKKRGCQGGTVCGSLRSGPLPKIVYLCVCVYVCFHSVCAASALLSQICASQSIFWESWVGKFGNWAPFKTSTLGLMLQFQNYVFSHSSASGA